MEHPEKLNEDIEPISHPYADDTPASVYAELKAGEKLILRAANDYFAALTAEERAHDKYEVAKGITLKALFDEERDETVKKRVEQHRQAIYRVRHHELRLDWQLAKRDAEAQKAFLDALLGIQTSIESRAKMIGVDERFAGRRYT